MKPRFLGMLAGFVLPPAIYWLGGGEFIRGPNLAAMSTLAVWLALCGHIAGRMAEGDL